MLRELPGVFLLSISLRAAPELTQRIHIPLRLWHLQSGLSSFWRLEWRHQMLQCVVIFYIFLTSILFSICLNLFLPVCSISLNILFQGLLPFFFRGLIRFLFFPLWEVLFTGILKNWWKIRDLNMFLLPFCILR